MRTHCRCVGVGVVEDRGTGSSASSLAKSDSLFHRLGGDHGPAPLERPVEAAAATVHSHVGTERAPGHRRHQAQLCRPPCWRSAHCPRLHTQQIASHGSPRGYFRKGHNALSEDCPSSGPFKDRDWSKDEHGKFWGCSQLVCPGHIVWDALTCNGCGHTHPITHALLITASLCMRMYINWPRCMRACLRAMKSTRMHTRVAVRAGAP